MQQKEFSIEKPTTLAKVPGNVWIASEDQFIHVLNKKTLNIETKFTLTGYCEAGVVRNSNSFLFQRC